MRDLATVRENHERFVRRAIESQVVWTVWGNAGPLIVSSQEQPSRDVYLLFSDNAYARRALHASWPDYPADSTREIVLFDLLYRWLPGLARDGHLCGTNWTGDLIGCEIEPADLARELRDRLPDELAAQYRERFTAGT